MTTTVEHVDMVSPASFVWDYDRTMPRLARLYEKSKTSQWNATTDVDWDVEVDPSARELELFGERQPDPDDPFRRWADTDEKFDLLTAHEHGWLVSQFMHGEQGALLATAKIVACSERVDDKFYAAQQVADEARHVEAYLRYLDKIDIRYPIAPYLGSLLDDVMSHAHVDMTFLGMQILVEGVALAAFNLGGALISNPLIERITSLVRADEARHVAFGVLALSGFYDDMDPVDLAEREEFVLDACSLMRDRFVMTDVWERLGLDVEACRVAMLDSPEQAMFRSLMFSKVVPNLRKLGLLTPRVREGFEQMGILRYERFTDSATEAGELEPEAVPAGAGAGAGAGDDPIAAMQAQLAGVERIAPAAVMAMLPALAKPERVREAPDARIRLRVDDDEDGDWTLVIDGDTVTADRTGEPGPQTAEVTITMDSAMWTDIVAGRKSAIEAFLNGGIKLDGDGEKALALEALL